MNKKLLILAGVLIVIAVVLYLLSAFVFNPDKVATTDKTNTPAQTNDTANNTGSTTETVAFPLSDAVTAALVKQAKSEFDFAFGKAKEWRDDSSPVAVVVNYTGSIDPKNGKDTYVFLSPSLSQFYFTITIDQNNTASGTTKFERLIRFKEDYFLPKNTVVMPMKYWVINYVDALKKADDLGGKTIRAESKGNYDVNLVLSTQEGEYILWDIEYLVGGEKKFGVTFDAFEGKVQ